MQITKQDIRDLRKSMGLAAHDITKIFDCTERTVYNKERPGHEPGDIVWYYALLWMEHRTNTPLGAATPPYNFDPGGITYID